MGWSMNDLRSRNRALAAVPDEGTAPTSTPPRVRPETAGAEEDANGRMSRRQSIIERARQLEESGAPVTPSEHRFKSSRPMPAGDGAEVNGAAANGRVGDPDGKESKPEGPSSRPNRRREVAGSEPEDEDKFPWHFQFDDDEPEELQASSPLLSRAFRATTG